MLPLFTHIAGRGRAVESIAHLITPLAFHTLKCRRCSVLVFFRKERALHSALTTRNTDGGAVALYARAAGLAYLIIITCGIYAEFIVRSQLIVRGDAAATAANIRRSEPLFRSALASEFIMLASDVFVALALLVVFEGVDRNLSRLAAFFRLMHAVVVAGNLLNMYVPLLLLSDARYLTAFEVSHRQSLIMLHLDTHAYGYAVGLVFFGVQCLLLAYLVFNSGFLPKLLGVLLACAGLGYLIDGFARTLLTHYARYQGALLLVVFVPALPRRVVLRRMVAVQGGEQARGVAAALRIGGDSSSASLDILTLASSWRRRAQQRWRARILFFSRV